MLPDSEQILHCEIQLDVYAALHYMILRAGGATVGFSKPTINRLMRTPRAARGI
jgi:hypothetical protein